jgi:LmbE family N-acetylglucosaminyl deacetylase
MTFPPSAPVLSDITRALCVFAHPDDVDFGSAGTVAHWVNQGIDVSYLLVTRGDAGGFDDTDRSHMPGIREAEQKAAAKAVGVTHVEFLEGYHDGTVTPSLQLRKDLVAAIRRYRPDRLLTSSPLRRWDRIAGPSHPDHLAVGEAVTAALYPDARNEFAHPDLISDHGLQPWVVREIWYAGGPNPDHAVDVTDTFPAKLAALQAHRSQTSHFDLEKVLRERLELIGNQLGLPEGRYAEAFNVFRTE